MNKLTTRQKSGREAKLKGHDFEEEVRKYLNIKTGKNLILEGKNNTKVDIRSEDNLLRYSVKKTPTSLQVGLITQQRFIDALGIKDARIIQFINEFFGGDDYAEFNRHRKKIHEIDPVISSTFLEFLHARTKDIMKVAITHGSLNQTDGVNYILFPSIKHDINTLQCVNIDSLILDINENGVWKFNPTTIDLFVNDNKIINIQMFGSGIKYSNGFHSLQFRISCGKIDKKHITSINT